MSCGSITILIPARGSLLQDPINKKANNPAKIKENLKGFLSIMIDLSFISARLKGPLK
jgi:hypothetical protein